MSYEIRLARVDEVAHLAAIERAAGRLFPAERIVDPEQTMAAALLTRACERGLLFLAVARADDRPVGFASCTEQDGCVHLDELSAHLDHGRQGLGRSPCP